MLLMVLEIITESARSNKSEKEFAYSFINQQLHPHIQGLKPKKVRGWIMDKSMKWTYTWYLYLSCSVCPSSSPSSSLVSLGQCSTISSLPQAWLCGSHGFSFLISWEISICVDLGPFIVTKCALIHPVQSRARFLDNHDLFNVCMPRMLTETKGVADISQMDGILMGLVECCRYEVVVRLQLLCSNERKARRCKS